MPAVIGIVVVILVIILSISSSVKQRSKKKRQEQEKQQQREQFNRTLSADEKAEVDKILAFTGKSHFYDVSPTEMRNYTVSTIAKDFEIPDWDIWDKTIHNANGQYDRMERAFRFDKDSISIICYDPKLKRAKISGKTDVYITGPFGCSCPDFKRRHLPCKHMYFLAAELDGNPEKTISSEQRLPLYGLRAFTTGRFSKYGNTDGVIKRLIECGGSWTDDLKTADLIIVGTSPSKIKLEEAESVGLLQISPEDIPQLFAVS